MFGSEKERIGAMEDEIVSLHALLEDQASGILAREERFRASIQETLNGAIAEALTSILVPLQQQIIDVAEQTQVLALEGNELRVEHNTLREAAAHTAQTLSMLIHNMKQATAAFELARVSDVGSPVSPMGNRETRRQINRQQNRG